jgi:hypothetical protein
MDALEPGYVGTTLFGCAESMEGVWCAPRWQCTQSVFCPAVSGPSDAIWQSEQRIALFACEPVAIGNFASGWPVDAGDQPIVL